MAVGIGDDLVVEHAGQWQQCHWNQGRRGNRNRLGHPPRGTEHRDRRRPADLGGMSRQEQRPGHQPGEGGAHDEHHTTKKVVLDIEIHGTGTLSIIRGR